MLNVMNQIRRMYNDDGTDDKSFDIQERRLKWALDNLKKATDELIRASNNLTDTLTMKHRKMN